MPDPALLSLEDAPPAPVGAPVAEPAPPSQAAPVPAAPPEPAPAGEPEPSDPQAAGLLKALREERARNKDLQEAANAGVQLSAALRANPKAYALLTVGDEPAAPAAPAPDAPSDQQLFELARDLALATPQGQYDLDAARRVYTLNLQVAERVARRVAGEAVAPLRQHQVTSVAQERSLKVLDTAKALGLDPAITKTVVDSVYASMPEAFGTVEGGAEVVVRIAGLQYLKDKGLLPGGTPVAAPGAPTPPPVFTERPGGPAPAAGPVALSAIEKRAAQRAGISEADWQKTVAATNQGAAPKRYLELE